ncbi:MAG: hypothetical protein DCF22_21750 [Leptolyngbya sp.]|nr:MAG: hypothetical protein DCF22_21750 [Leptolyngbya sp.]
MEGIDLVIVGAIAGMIAIAKPTLKPLNPDSSIQTRATAATQTLPSEYNTPEHAKYKGINWGALAAKSPGQYIGSTQSTQSYGQSTETRSQTPISGDSPELKAQLDSELASLPSPLRNATKTVAIRQGCSPYSDCKTMASAQGGAGLIEVWRGGQGYVPSLVHEAAHLLAYQKWRTYVPPGYQELWQSEGGVSEYGSTSPTEDFAEAVQQYTEGRLQSERKREFVQKALNE